MKIKVIIVDDEMHARSFLRKFCERYHSDTIDVLEECSSVESAVRAIKRYQPDLIFLDIQIPDENGFELLKYFDKINFEIIFTTAYKEFAIDAIRKSALDYLVKPFSTEDFNIAISRFFSKKNIKIDFDRFKLLIENINVGKDINVEDIQININIDTLKLIPADYDVSVTEKAILFKSTTSELQYVVILNN